MWKKIRWLLVVIAVGLLAWSLFFTGDGDDVKSPYTTVRLTRGNIRQIVTATGEIKPLNTIKVGSQVSGNIEKIYVDFNSAVKKGEVLLTIEPSVLRAAANEALASLDSAKSQLKYDEAEYKRATELFKSGFIARSEMESSKTKYETSQQTVNRMQSQYERAVVNLGYATITSPVDGTVISRKVDAGQTVAASFSAPDLFEIAEDLSKMQIETAISEADIGMIKNGQSVTFTVDAYPTQTFSGKVNQIRLSPTTTQNVVVYTVIIDVDNSDLKLMPGMTAFVTVLIEERDDIWKAENSAFLVRSYKPILPDNKDIADGKATPSDTLLILRGNDVLLIPYKKGLSTSTESEIISEGLEKGDMIITGRTGAATGAANAGRMPGPMGAIGGGGRR
ncbi:MAG: efflux RND transporter periplasmic adaptor subunit [Rickettsiales bacterium]|jgi:HlyD family secretion protein|nr:efflux RND transporter periplasmic adaptor subunit [Rickettsiales bacterium]